MKKKLVVLLAVVMMFAFSASAYAATFSDVSERSVTEQDAIAKAVALGIIEGYEDGTFGPDKTITRAEFAKIAVTAAGAKDTASMLEANASAFKDVRANSWYTGWINAAESLGIFKGDQNGNFRPNDTISNQEAITVMMRLLGYNDNLTGTWPVNYVTKANQINMLDDVNIVASAAAKRGDIVVMLSATLDTDIVTYDKDTNEFVKKQTTKSDSSWITLLEDSFEGAYVEVTAFPKVEQVRDAANKTLNWAIPRSNIVETSNSANTVPTNFIIDENTAVSHNAAGLFDLEYHQGNVYYVKDTDGKYYARFIEVESYTQKVSDPVKKGTTNATVKVGTTSYNALNTKWTTLANGEKKNSSYYMYFNDDDQVYQVTSDKDYKESAYYVKSVGASSVRLVGTNTTEKTTSTTANMNDADTLIWDGSKFISPSDLEVGDAIMAINAPTLYVKVDEKSGDLTRTNTATTGAESGNTLYRLVIGGSNYVYSEAATPADPKDAPKAIFYDNDLDDSGVSVDDVFNNNVKFIQNKNNSLAAVIVDETSTGTTLYGIMMDSEGGGSIANRTSSVTLYTQEGYTVTYDYAKTVTGAKLTADEIGMLVEYKLNSNGEIKTMNAVKDGFAPAAIGSEPAKTPANNKTKPEDFTLAGASKKIEVENNNYLKLDGTASPKTLAANVIIFEVSSDNGDVDPSIVTRSALLGGGDFTPETVRFDDIYFGGSKGTQDVFANYAVYKTNTNGAIKVLAYTEASGSNYHYGVIKAWKFTDADHNGASNNDYAVTLVGDDTVYDLDTASVGGGADQFVIYQLSGDKLTVVMNFKNDGNLLDYTRMVTGYNNGLITVEKGWAPGNKKQFGTNLVEWNNTTKPTDKDGNEVVYSVATDSNTVVYVIDANTGDYTEGSLSDISTNSYVYIPVIDEDGYADIVLVDEYPRNGNNGGGNNGGNTSSSDDVEKVLYYDNATDYNAANENTLWNDPSGIDVDYVYDSNAKTLKVTVVDDNGNIVKGSAKLGNGSWQPFVRGSYTFENVGSFDKADLQVKIQVKAD